MDDKIINPKQQHFLILRSEGKSFDSIAKELQISKRTAIQWSKLLQDDINELRFFALQMIRERYAFNLACKYETLLKHLDKVNLAIENMDFTNVSLKDLALFKTNILAEIGRIERQTNINTGVLSNDIVLDQFETLCLNELY